MATMQAHKANPRIVLELGEDRMLATMPKQSRRKPAAKDRHLSPRITLRLPAPAGDILRAIARQNHRTLTAEVLLALRRHAEENGFKWPEDPD